LGERNLGRRLLINNKTEKYRRKRITRQEEKSTLYIFGDLCPVLKLGRRLLINNKAEKNRRKRITRQEEKSTLYIFGDL
jgi:hypothetical protein